MILKSVVAKFLHTTLAVNGKIVDVSKDIKGRTIYLNASSDNARIEDLLRLAVNSDEPLMTGSANLKTTIDIPEGEDDLLDRMKLAGQFGVGHAQFTSATVQEKVDTLSRKGQGKPKDTDISEVASDLRGNFRFADGVVTFSSLSFAVQGASLHLDGTYNIDSTAMDFQGRPADAGQTFADDYGRKIFLSEGGGPVFQRQERRKRICTSKLAGRKIIRRSVWIKAAAISRLMRRRKIEQVEPRASASV